MTAYKYLILLLLITILSSCKTKSKNFRYADKPDIIECNVRNYPLLKEAFYSFENDLFTYTRDSLNADRASAYNRWVYPSHANTYQIKTLVSPYTIEIFERLKSEEPQLFDVNNKESNLNYNSELITCIAANMTSGDLKTTFNALISTNTMSPKLFGDALIFNLLRVTNDPYMRFYVVFEYGYGHMFFTDFSDITNAEMTNADKR